VLREQFKPKIKRQALNKSQVTKGYIDEEERS
jgi:hypothetical protein